MQLNTKYTIPNSVMLQTVDDESLLLDTESEEFFSLNEMGRLIWNAMQQHNTLDAIRIEFLELYDVSSDILSQDLLLFGSTLKEKGLLSADT